MTLADLFKLIHDRNEIPYGISYPSIIEEIRKYKELKAQGRSDKNPIILIYFPSLVLRTKKSTLEILRGDYSQLLAKLQSFFHHLVDEDVELVFFCEGYIVPRKEENWLKRKTEHYWQECDLIKDVENGADLSKYKPFYNHYRDYLKHNLESYGTWIKILVSNIHTEMARYAREKNVFAVFNDTNEFLIFEGGYHLWHIKYTDFDKLTTKQINKANIRKALGLSQEHMPLFGILCGNDVIPEEKLQKFHDSFQKENKIKDIARYVKQVMAEDKEIYIQEVSNRIGCSVEEVKASLDHYNLSTNRVTEEEAEGSFLKKVRLDGLSFTYSILRHHPLRIGPYFEDIRSPFLEVHQLDLCLRLQRRLLGIIFKNNHDQKLTHPLYTIRDHEKGYELIKLTPEYPPIDLPDLEELMFDEQNKELRSIRYELLQWIFKCGDVREFNKIPSSIVPVLLTLHVMIQEAKLQTTDADVILLSFYDTKFTKMPKLPKPEPKMDVFAFQLMHYYLRIQTYVMRAMSILGLKMWSDDYPEFNGPYFHYLHKEWKDLNVRVKNGRLSEIKNLRLYSTKM